MSTKHDAPFPPPSAAEIKARLRVLRMVRLGPPITDLLKKTWDDVAVAAWIFLLRGGYTRVVRIHGPQTDHMQLTELGIQYLADLERAAAPGANGGA